MADGVAVYGDGFGAAGGEDVGYGVGHLLGGEMALLLRVGEPGGGLGV